jgi:hypothetical protein
MKKLLCLAATAATLLCVSALPSLADQCSGTCGDPPLGVDPSGATFTDQNIANGTVVTDIFDFSLSSPPSNYSSAVVDLTLSHGVLTNFTISVIDLNTDTVADSGLFTFSAPSQPTFVNLGPFNLTAPDSYALEITGTANGLVSYGGAVSTVGTGSGGTTPLPGTLALLAGGLGLLGFAGRKKRGKNSLTSLATAA